MSVPYSHSQYYLPKYDEFSYDMSAWPPIHLTHPYPVSVKALLV